MISNKQGRVEEIARKGEAIAGDALEEADRLLIKTATLRHQVNRLKDELAEEIASRDPKE